MTDTQHTPEHQPGRGRDAAGLEATRVRGAMPMAAEGHSGPAVASAPAHSSPRYDGAAKETRHTLPRQFSGLPGTSTRPL
ncbi:hypothetical protein SC377_02745, partial [Actinotignum sp. SLA_B059]|uniref:hypothetical protein n=1 Tax=Actinotignum sp. SLA_B059 TaxID=3083287 RepID=UPI002A807DAA